MLFVLLYSYGSRVGTFNETLRGAKLHALTGNCGFDSGLEKALRAEEILNWQITGKNVGR